MENDLEIVGTAMAKVWTYIKEIFEIDRFVESCKSSSSLRSKRSMQLLVALAFFILSLANVFSRSYWMLVFTASGCIVNLVFAVLAKKLHNGNLCALSSIATCSALFGFFVIYGGNDGFSCLWVVLLPLLSMVSMSFVMGLCACSFFQVFLIVVFWTPIREMLFYRYNDQFCLRFPLFFFVTFILGLLLTVSLRKSQYNDRRHLLELEKMTETAQDLARTDSLTKLANRRSAYEKFEAQFAAEGQPHCIVMGDIDYFKRVNDTYGHKFGDDVLVTIAKYITELLPADYLKSRWGGEEFLFAANAPLDEVFTRIENLRKSIADHEYRFNGAPVHVTITFGIAQYHGKEGITKAITMADNRLYSGKVSEKNCTVIEG